MLRGLPSSASNETLFQPILEWMHLFVDTKRMNKNGGKYKSRCLVGNQSVGDVPPFPQPVRATLFLGFSPPLRVEFALHLFLDRSKKKQRKSARPFLVTGCMMQMATAMMGKARMGRDVTEREIILLRATVMFRPLRATPKTKFISTKMKGEEVFLTFSKLHFLIYHYGFSLLLCIINVALTDDPTPAEGVWFKRRSFPHKLSCRI